MITNNDSSQREEEASSSTEETKGDDKADESKVSRVTMTTEEILISAKVLPCSVKELKSIAEMKERIANRGSVAGAASMNNLSSNEESNGSFDSFDAPPTNASAATDEVTEDGTGGEDTNEEDPYMTFFKVGGRRGSILHSIMPLGVGGSVPASSSPTASSPNPKDDSTNNVPTPPTRNDAENNVNDTPSKFESNSRDNNGTNNTPEEEKQYDDEAFIMHYLFQNFSNPSPSFYSVREILDLERRRLVRCQRGNHPLSSEDREEEEVDDDIVLPRDVIIQVGTTTSNIAFLLSSIDPNYSDKNGDEKVEDKDTKEPKSRAKTKNPAVAAAFLALPLHFQLALLRILIRLLTNETDKEFDEECLMDYHNPRVTSDVEDAIAANAVNGHNYDSKDECQHGSDSDKDVIIKTKEDTDDKIDGSKTNNENGDGGDVLKSNKSNTLDGCPTLLPIPESRSLEGESESANDQDVDDDENNVTSSTVTGTASVEEEQNDLVGMLSPGEEDTDSFDDEEPCFRIRGSISTQNLDNDKSDDDNDDANNYNDTNNSEEHNDNDNYGLSKIRPRTWGKSSLAKSINQSLSSESDPDGNAQIKNNGIKSLLKESPKYSGSEKDNAESNRKENEKNSKKSGGGRDRRLMWLEANMNYKYSSTQRTQAIKVDRLYSVVRLRCGEIKDDEGVSCRVDSILGLIKTVLRLCHSFGHESRQQGLQENCDSSLFHQLIVLGPLTRLLGLLCTAGISVKQLRCMLSLISYPCESSLTSPTPKEDAMFVPTIARLHLIRALTIGTEGASLAKKLLGKASPRCFFSFGRCDGMAHTVSTTPAPNSTTTWPFKTNFGMALWFRAESFSDPEHIGPLISVNSSKDGNARRKNPIILSILTEDGGGIEISLELFESNYKNTRRRIGSAASIVVTMFDSSAKTANSTRVSRSVELSGCPIVPRAWYHLALRHTKKGYLSLAKDEITILLDGKVMLSKPLRFPKININDGTSKQLRNVISQPQALRRVTSSDSSSLSNAGHFRIRFWADIDGQTGALYLFKDNVSDATLRALYEVTAGTVASVSNQTHSAATRSSLIDNSWTSTRGLMVQHESKVSMGLKPVDAEEIVVGSAGRISTVSGGQVTTGQANALHNCLEVVDLGGDDERAGDYVANPHLSKAAFASKIYLVWDPARVSMGNLVLEAHAGAHVILKDDKVTPWKLNGAKDVIGSIGGVQCLLPLFRSLLSEGNVEKGWVDCAEGAVAESNSSLREYCQSSLIIPSLFSLLAAFLRDNDDNSREFLRCGGVDIVVQSILENKMLYVQPKSQSTTTTGKLKPILRSSVNATKWTVTSALRSSPKIAQECVDVLVDLRDACSHNMSLETKIYSRLIFNVDLWFGGVSKSPGVALHAALLPLLSSLAKSSPKKARDCVGAKEMVDLIREYTTLSSTEEDDSSATTKLFDRTSSSGMNPAKPLTVNERRHVVDVIFAILVTMLSLKTAPSHLGPLLNFISYNMDMEWETANTETHNTENAKLAPMGTRRERFIASKKACIVLLFLMQSRPLIPGFYESLFQCIDDVPSWLLCCMVNSFDDKIRAIGIRCLTAFLEVSDFFPISSHNTGLSPDVLDDNISVSSERTRTDTSIGPSQLQISKGAASKLSNTIKIVGAGLRVVNLPKIFALKSNVIIYKLLWHILKCHRFSLGSHSHSALSHLLIDSGNAVNCVKKAFLLDSIIVSDEHLKNGFRLNEEWTDVSLSELGSDTDQKIRNSFVISMVMRLMRFLPGTEKERWLFDLLALIRVSKSSIHDIVATNAWQACMFQIVSETIEELSCQNNVINHDKQTINVAHFQESSSIGIDVGLVTRYEMSLKLYSMLIGHCVREGGDKGFQALEQAVSLQRICLNGEEVVGVLLSHILSDLMENGTIIDIISMTPLGTGQPSERNRALKESARVVTKAILSNGTDGMDMASAVKQWKNLRHLTAITVAVVTASGFGMAELFDYRNYNASAVDEASGGLHGIRLPDGPTPGIASSDVTAETAFDRHIAETASIQKKSGNEHRRRVCIVLASQLLSLLDPFIFPDNLDATKPTSQLHGLTLVQSVEPRLGQSQGPILASLLRLSLVLLCHLEPSSVKFLQCCSRLRCFLHWSLELIRESSARSGYSVAFHELTAPLDRLVLCVVLQCHRALSRCSAVLIEIETSPVHKYFSDIDSRQKNYRRLFRATLELREIVLGAFRGRNEVLRAALSLQAYEALQTGLEEMATAQKRSTKTKEPQRRKRHNTSRNNNTNNKETSLRAFLANAWVTAFHDVDIQGDIAVPEQVANGQVYRNRTASDRGFVVMQELSLESRNIIDEYNQALNVPFNNYLEDHRNWTDTEAVRDLEYDGNLAINRLSGRYRSEISERHRLELLRKDAANHRWLAIERKVEPWNQGHHWKLAKHTDRLQRRILLIPNRNFNNHEYASYELMLGKEREKALKEREERLRKKREKELSAMVRVASEGIIHQVRDENTNENNNGNNDSPNEEDVSTMVRAASMGIVRVSENNGIDADDDATLEPEEESDNSSVECESGEEDATMNSRDDDNDGDWDQVEEEDTLAAMTGDVSSQNESYSWAKAFIWSEGEQIVHFFESVVLVSLQTLTKGELLLTTHGLYFRPTDDDINVMTKEKAASNIRHDSSEINELRWRLSRLTEVHGRRYMLRAQALELFFADTHEVFLNFNNGPKERDKFYSKLRNCKVPMLSSPKSLNPRSVFSKNPFTELWKRRKISNFEYLMQLNIMAGRTFNDITQYPVFPWVIADYESEKLDLNDPKTFRDLSKPVGALNEKRLSQLIERYHNLDGFPEEEKFLYGSHYSSPGVVLHYLIRQEPFTTMAIELQSGRFDCPDRLFFDIAGCWRSCLQSTSDVKELTPEFFTCPEIFINTNNFPLGETQSRIDVNHVKLPPWANNSPYEFVRLHRLALESEFVSRHLNKWIDLIFGFKQRGAEALKAHNVFHYLSYEGSVDLDKITDEVDRKATESHIQNFGQTPSQLLIKDHHPSRYPADECWRPMICEFSSLRRLRCHTPSKQFGGNLSSTLHGAALSIHVLTEQIVVIYADLSIGTYRWSPSRSGNAAFFFRMDKLRSLGCRDMSMSPFAVNARLPGSESDINMTYRKLKKKMDWRKSGTLEIGNWSFAMTLGGSLKDLMRKRAPGHLRSKEASTSNLDLSSLLISCGYYDNTVKVHSFDGLRLRCSERGGHRGPINCFCVGEDGGLMITGGQDATCRVWTVDHADMGTALTDGYVQTALGKANLESADSMLMCCHILWGHEAAISCISFSSELDVVVSGSIDGVICIHSVRRGKFVRSIHVDNFFAGNDMQRKKGNGFKIPVRKLALDNDGTFVAHLDDGLLQMYTINGVKLGCVDAGEKLHAMEIVPGGSMLVTGGESCHVVVRTLHDLGIRCVLDLSNYGPIHCISFTPPYLKSAPQFMFIGTADGNVTVVYNGEEGENRDEEDCLDIPYTNVSNQVVKNGSSAWWSRD